jgi:hypothetical protein
MREPIWLGCRLSGRMLICTSDLPSHWLDRTPSNQRRQPHFSLFATTHTNHTNHTRTPPTPHHSFACPPPEVLRPAAMLRRYSPLRARHRGLRRMAARIFGSAQVPSVTPGHERILPLSRHSSHDTCPRPQMPRESRGRSPRNASFFLVASPPPPGPAELCSPTRTGPATSSRSSQTQRLACEATNPILTAERTLMICELLRFEHIEEEKPMSP